MLPSWLQHSYHLMPVPSEAVAAVAEAVEAAVVAVEVEEAVEVLVADLAGAGLPAVVAISVVDRFRGLLRLP